MPSHHRFGSVHLNNSFPGLKSVSSGVKHDNTTNTGVIVLGGLEKEVLEFIVNKLSISTRAFRLRDLWSELKIDRRIAHEVVSRLVSKGFLEKVRRGIYRIVPEKIQEFLRSTVKIIQKRRKRKTGEERSEKMSGFNPPATTPPTSPPDQGLNIGGGRGLYVGGYNVSGGGCCGGVFLFLDNVKGVTVGGLYRNGDAGYVLVPWVVSESMRRVDYGEFNLFVADSSLAGFPGVVTVYPVYILGVGYGLKFEFRPYDWFNDSVLRGSGGDNMNLVLGFRYMWRVFLSVWLVLGRVLLEKAPLEVRRIASSWIRRRCRSS
jgi:predicted DNA-binding transcriptional regulator